MKDILLKSKAPPSTFECSSPILRKALINKTMDEIAKSYWCLQEQNRIIGELNSSPLANLPRLELDGEFQAKAAEATNRFKNLNILQPDDIDEIECFVDEPINYRTDFTRDHPGITTVDLRNAEICAKLISTLKIPQVSQHISQLESVLGELKKLNAILPTDEVIKSKRTLNLVFQPFYL